MASAQLKLMAALPDGWREDAERVSSRFHLDPIDWYRGPAATDHLPAIAEAVWNERRIQVHYDSWNGVVDRTLEPLGLVLKAGTWYMAAAAPGKSPRTYRLSNVLELRDTGERFKRPKRFDLAAYWRESTQRFEAELYRDRAVVRVTPRGWKTLRGFSAAVADALDACDTVPVAGWREVTIPIETIEHATRQLLRLGTDVQVIAPPALRDGMAATVAAMAALCGLRVSPRRVARSARA
jgi:predicted DNA-binding transcriptional regulator YafY